jgi:hypothetical protein
MKYLGKFAICLAGGLVWITAFGASNPYASIAERNIFGLNPPEAIAPQTREPPSKITPDGIMTIFGTKQVLFYVDIPPRPPTPASRKSYILSEGQRQDDIEVTHIDDKKSVVTFNNHGVVQEIPLVKAAPITTPTPVVIASAVNAPAAAAGGRNYAAGGANAPRFGNRFGQNPNQNTGNNARNQSGPGFANASSAAGRSAQPQLSPEEQMIMIAAQHAHAQQTGDPIARIFPPTELDKDAGVVPETPVGSPSTP